MKEKEFNLKYVLYEAKKKILRLFLISIAVALLFTGYSYVNAKKQKENQQYGAFCELYVESSRIDTIEVDMASFTLPVVESDAFMTNISNDQKIKERGITLKELEKMIYAFPKSGGTVIRISTVASDNKTAELLCKIAMKNAMALYSSKDFEVDVQHQVCALGSIAIETKDNLENPYEPITLVNKVNEVSITPLFLLKKSLEGFILGLIAALAYIGGVFVLSDKIIYAGQVSEELKMKLLYNSNNDNGFEELYSNLTMCGESVNKLCFLSLQKLNSGNDFLEKYSQFMDAKGKKVVLIDVMDGGLDESLFLEERDGLCFGQLNSRALYDSSLLKKILDKLDSEFDCIFIENDNLKSNPAVKALCKYADGVVLMIESDSNKISDIETIESELDLAGGEVLGCAFLD